MGSEMCIRDRTTRVSKLDKDSQVVAILLRIADAVSAANDNKVGATGRKESIISPSGLSQPP